MERRFSERISMHLSGLARVAGRSERVTISDLSAEGCRLVTSHGFVEVGDSVALKFTEIRIRGDVVWQCGREVGLQFHSRLHPAIVAHLGFQGLPIEEGISLAKRLGRSAPVLSKKHQVLTDRSEVVAFFQR